MMENPSANKSHIPCQSWVGPTDWSTASTQNPIHNPLTRSQHRNLRSSSDQRPSCDHLQTSSQSCMNSLGSFQSSLYKPFHSSSSPLSSTAYFANNAVQSPSHAVPFAQQRRHTSSVLLTSNQGKTIPTPSLPQPEQRLQPFTLQHLQLASPHNPYQTFQASLTNQGTPNGLQDVSVSLPSCGQEQAPWTLSSHCREAVNKSVPDAAPQANNEPSQEANTIPPPASNEKRRSTLLNQRAQLFKQLAEIDKLLESVPQDDSSDDLSPHTAVQPEQTEEDRSSPAICDEQNETRDIPEDQMSTGQSEENAFAELEDDYDSDYRPDSVGDRVSDLPSDTDGHSSDESIHSDNSSAGDKKPPSGTKSVAKCGSSSSEDEHTSPINKIFTTHKKPSEAVVLPTSNSKAQRVYNKRNYCLFCSRSLTKMARHFERMHSDQAVVAAAFQYPVKSKERRKIWNKLINEGNFAHNKEVLKAGKGQLAVRKRPKQIGQAKDFLHCLYCRGLYVKKGFFKHLRNCPEKVKDKNIPRLGRKSMTLQCVLETSGDLGISDGLKSILCGMIYDDVTQAIMDDKIILQLGEQMFDHYGSDAKKHSYIKQNLRQIARLLLEAQKATPLKNLEEFFFLSSFRHVVSAVNVLAGYDPESKTYKVPSLALKLGYQLQKACLIVENNAVKCGDQSLADSARKFLSVYQKKWNKRISSDALTSLRETKLITDKKVPLVQDVKCLNFHMEDVHNVVMENLRTNVSTENYAALAKLLLARTVLFNSRRGTEVSSIQLEHFTSRKKSDVLDDMDESVSDLERTMCGFFNRVDIRGTSGRMVPILLKPTFESALVLLVDVRTKCGVPSENHFLFGRPNTLTAYNPSECIQHYVKECAVKNPEALTIRKIKKHYGTMLQMINLDDKEADQILGPDNQVRALRQNSSMQLDDEMVFEGSENKDEHIQDKVPQKASTNSIGTLLPKSVKSRKKGLQKKDKHKWEEAEVQAVERHMMRFIQGHKVPQKHDCIHCLEAESEALKTRTWKGVKDYVRNRITTLQRRSGSSRALPKKRKKPQQVKPTRARPRTAAESETLPPKSVKKKEKGSKNKDNKHKWGEAEVRAVEQHLMHLIEGHKIPQKNDCLKCLAAEPVALRNRTWKGVKDYVRNRITSLKRQGCSSQALFANRYIPEQVEPHQSTVHFQQW